MHIKKDALVSIDLELQDENGNTIEENDQEVIYLHGGYGHLFQKLEEALEGKKVGDRFCVKLAASEAFGEFREELVLRESLEDLPPEVSLGMELDGEEEGVVFRVVELDATHALVDGNHPYAGVPMIAKGEVREIEYLSPEAIGEILKEEHHH